MLLECVINVSEGRDTAVLDELAAAAGPALLHRHRDPDHNRAVFTLAGSVDLVADASRTLAAATLSRLDLRRHAGAHPRLGVLDVVPFVPYERGHPGPRTSASPSSNETPSPGGWARRWGCRASSTGLFPAAGRGPCPTSAVSPSARDPTACRPTSAPQRPDPRTGASAVGTRRVLVAYNVWVSSVEVARRVAPLVRSPEVRALGLAVGARGQVSCNLVDPGRYGPLRLYDAVAALVRAQGGEVEGGELVGLIPEVVLATVPSDRRAELGLSEEATVESRLPADR